MILQIHPQNPEGRKLNQVIEILKQGGVIIIPTDSVYALVCDMSNQKAVDKICRLRQLDPVKANLTFLCDNISRVSSYTAPIPNEHFRLLKRNAPGPFTFILNSNQSVPKLFKNKKKTIGARIPDHLFIQQLVAALDRPLMSATMIEVGEDFRENDIREIEAMWGNRVDIIVECGIVPNHETAIVDLTQDDVIIVREGMHQLK
jgi:tRNA threonylcarbamoyl adenosine modification protein (Sua5/YciO/YrdC/YwlC family)